MSGFGFASGHLCQVRDGTVLPVTWSGHEDQLFDNDVFLVLHVTPAGLIVLTHFGKRYVFTGWGFDGLVKVLR